MQSLLSVFTKTRAFIKRPFQAKRKSPSHRRASTGAPEDNNHEDVTPTATNTFGQGVDAPISDLVDENTDSGAFEAILQDLPGLVGDLKDEDLTIADAARVVDTLYDVAADSCCSTQNRIILKGLIIRMAHVSGHLPSAFSLCHVMLKAPSSPAALGGYGSVYEGSRREARVAVKHLRCLNRRRSPAGPSLEGPAGELAHEVIVWSMLEHEHIVPFTGVATISNFQGYSMVSPWMENGDIMGYLEKRCEGCSGFQRIANKLLCQVAQAIHYIHGQGIVHGDIRGPNILIDNGCNARLTDFGSATLLGVVNIRERSHRLGALSGRAPELIVGSGEPTFACDIYAFGILCVEVYLGENPYHGQVREHIMLKVAGGGKPSRPMIRGREMPMELWSLVQKCLTKRPTQRPSAHGVLTRMKSI